MNASEFREQLVYVMRRELGWIDADVVGRALDAAFAFRAPHPTCDGEGSVWAGRAKKLPTALCPDRWGSSDVASPRLVIGEQVGWRDPGDGDVIPLDTKLSDPHGWPSLYTQAVLAEVIA